MFHVHHISRIPTLGAGAAFFAAAGLPPPAAGLPPEGLDIGAAAATGAELIIGAAGADTYVRVGRKRQGSEKDKKVIKPPREAQSVC